MNDRPLFHPTFGSRPAKIIGRDQVLEEYLKGLRSPVGSRERCVFFRGQRGIGKTSILLEIEDRAKEMDYVVAIVTAYDGMCEDIIETIQRNGAEFVRDKKNLTGVSAGALGFSFGLNFSEATEKQYGFRSKMTLLSEKLAECGKGILVLVDEACTSAAMRELAITYQHLVGEDRNIAIAMAGLPQAVSNVLNDDVLTFLNRAKKIDLGPIDMIDIQMYFMHVFNEFDIKCDQEVINNAAAATHGFPYLFQILGYYILSLAEPGSELTQDLLDQAVALAKKDMEQSVYAPIMSPLSDNDIRLLKAVADEGDSARVAEILKKLGWSNSELQPYRARMLDADILESPRSGTLEFAIPFFSEYIKDYQMQDM